MLSSLSQTESLLTLSLRVLFWAFSATMNPVFVENAFWISATVNMSTLLFFLSRSCVGAIGRRYFYAEGMNDYRRSLYELHDDKKWYIPRVLVAASQSALLTVLGLILLTHGKVIHRPFYGLSPLSRICFAMNIGCYVYRIAQDGILHRHLSKVSVDAVHHVVTVSVYSVFLMYEQNALFGALGMLFASTTPFIEVRRLLKSAGLERYSKFSGINLLVCCILTLLGRLVIPASLIIWSILHGSPLTMDVVVVAIYFLSAIFFGILNLWLVVTSIRAVFKFWHKERTLKLERILGAGKPHGLEIEASDRCKFTTKRNDLNLMLPCSNANIAPQNPVTANTQRFNIPSKSYQKANLNELLNNPVAAAAATISPTHTRQNFPRHNSRSQSILISPVAAANTNANVQITDWDRQRSSTSLEDSSNYVSFPLQVVTHYLDRSSAESSSTASDVETSLGSHARRTNNRHSGDRRHVVEVARTQSEGHPVMDESDTLLWEGRSTKHDNGQRARTSGSPSTSILIRSERAPLTRSVSGGALDGSSSIYSMQMAIMREHVLNLHSNRYESNDARSMVGAGENAEGCTMQPVTSTATR